jgi:hypothetical protein
MTISEIRERLQRVAVPLYQKFRRVYREWSTEELAEVLVYTESDLLPGAWHTNIQWDAYSEHFILFVHMLSRNPG